MKTKIYILIIVLAVLTGLIATELTAKGTRAGTRITNFATVDYAGGSKTNLISTNVMAIYGMIPTIGTQSNTTPSGVAFSFDYIITNNGNDDMDYIVTLSNFNISALNWQAWLRFDTITSKTMQGALPPFSVTNNVLEGSITVFTLYIKPDAASGPGDWGQIPMIIQASNSLAVNTNGGYWGDNTIFYGGTNYLVYYPRVTVAGPYIVLKKVLDISGAMGGIPVPDSVITYTNYYDNDGNAPAVDLRIIDRIPRDTDFITGSLIYAGMLHTGAIVNIEYWNRTGTVKIYDHPIPLADGTADPEVGEIRINFSPGASVDKDNRVGLPDPTDLYGVPDGTLQDADAGYFYYKVVVHRRR